MLFGMVGQLGKGIKQACKVGNCPTGRGNFGGGYGTYHWGICGVVEQKCEKRWSCHLGWWVGSAQTLVY